ncbi:DnaD domain protein [Cohnella faecalis]|uniref:Helicase DnaB n=1 Tax=Cohnella faecalis TaxID=2315694 RepID=A0A398CKU2_9BACL|nr:DnaD domain protein [Cohnella faecalis]RIE02782.1 helicase DnaB [Cohnella faecalis]
MRVSNILEFTENHRYTVYRDFALSGLDRAVLTRLYQPMVGAFAIGLYLLLYHQMGDDRTGYAAPDSQRKLFLGLDLEMNPSGRKALIDNASKLEAVGLMQAYRHHDPVSEETLYEYALNRPLSIGEFFASMHLTLLLRDKIGKPAVMELRGELMEDAPAGLARFVNREEVTVPFYELFQIGGGTVDRELEQALAESAPTRERTISSAKPEKIRQSDILLRFPRGSANRVHVERLHLSPESMGQINYLAYKFDLDVPEVCRLLDEDGLFHNDGTLQWDEMNRRANLVYRQDRKRDEERERFMARGEGRSDAARDEPADPLDPSYLLNVPERFLAEVSQDRYNEMLRREPYTRMLEKYFPGSVPDSFIRIFEKIDLNYKLPEPVINVLIHYVLGMKHAQRLTGAFIDSVASNMLAKGIDTFRRAVAYVREQDKLNASLERKKRGETEGSGQAAGSSGGSSRGRTTRRKPDMPVVADRGPTQEVSAEEREKMRELARKLKGDG